MDKLQAITKTIQDHGVAIDGVSSDGRIDFRPEATEAQRTLAQNIFDNWPDQTLDDLDKKRLAKDIEKSRLIRLLLAGENITAYTTADQVNALVLLVRYLLKDTIFNWTLEARK